MPSELRAEPAASTAPAELAASCERAAAEGRAEADMALTEGMATTNTLNQAIQETDAVTALTVSPAPSLEFCQKGVSSPQQASSLGPGLKASQDHVAPQAMSAGPAQPLGPSQWGGKASTSWVKLGKLLPWTAHQVSPMPFPPGASHGQGHPGETGVLRLCGRRAANGHREPDRRTSRSRGHEPPALRPTV